MFKTWKDWIFIYSPVNSTKAHCLLTFLTYHYWIRKVRIQSRLHFNSQAGVKNYELRTKSKEQLESQLIDLKKELAELKVAKLSKPSLPKINTVRKNIARVLTIINEQQRAAVRELYKGKKYQPKDLRAKKTRALRRALTKFESSRITVKQQKKQIAFPQRKYAIKA